MKSKPFSFRVNIEAENGTGRLLSVYVQVRDGKSASVREYANGNVFADYDKQGNLLGIELLAPCDPKVIERIAKQQSAKRFVRNAVPRGMLVPA